MYITYVIGNALFYKSLNKINQTPSITIVLIAMALHHHHHHLNENLNCLAPPPPDGLPELKKLVKGLSSNPLSPLKGVPPLKKLLWKPPPPPPPPKNILNTCVGSMPI